MLWGWETRPCDPHNGGAEPETENLWERKSACLQRESAGQPLRTAPAHVRGVATNTEIKVWLSWVSDSDLNHEASKLTENKVKYINNNSYQIVIINLYKTSKCIK